MRPPRVEPVRAKDDFLVFGRPDIQEPEIDEVVASLRSGWVGTGPKVARFEADFQSYKGATNAVAVGSCTAALHLSILAAGIGAGDEVITTPMTFCATANAIIHAGATPVLVDVEDDLNIHPEAVAEAIGPRTKAILPVHFAGRPCDVEGLWDLCQDHDLRLIEDCAHAIEAKSAGEHVGTKDVGCFSFYATKNVVTAEGGMVTTRDGEAAARIKTLALHGMTKDAWKRYGDEGYKHYQVVEAGYKYNMTDLQAALGIHQLARVEANLKRRRAVWDAYDKQLPSEVDRPADRHMDGGDRHALHLYTIQLDQRDRFLDRMTAQGVGVGVHYLALPEHPYYQEHLGWRTEDFPNATAIGRRTVSLPLGSNLSDDDVGDVLEAVSRCV